MNVAENNRAIYTYIGQRIRQRRRMLKLSQTELASLMGFSYQQMQKYESGASHVTAGKLLHFAKYLNVTPAYFYEGLNINETIGHRIDSQIIQKERSEPLRILLVDDNPADMMMFKKTLQTCNEPTEVHYLHEPEAAMNYLQSHEAKYGQRLPDIIVLDLNMPKLNGINLLKFIKRNARTTEIPVIVLTHSVSVRDMVEAYKSGAAGFIQKSVDSAEYSENIRAMITYWAKTVALPCM